MPCSKKEKEESLAAKNRLEQERDPEKSYWGDSKEDRFCIQTKAIQIKDSYNPVIHSIPNQI